METEVRAQPTLFHATLKCPKSFRFLGAVFHSAISTKNFEDIGLCCPLILSRGTGLRPAGWGVARQAGNSCGEDREAILWPGIVRDAILRTGLRAGCGKAFASAQTAATFDSGAQSAGRAALPNAQSGIRTSRRSVSGLRIPKQCDFRDSARRSPNICPLRRLR